MLTPVGVVLIGLGFLVACLLAIYLYVIRINSRTAHLSISDVNDKEYSAEENSDIFTATSLNVNTQKIKKKKNKNVRSFVDSSTESSISGLTSSSSSLQLQMQENNDEDDILALASLRGYDISNIRRRKPIVSSNSTIVTKVEQKDSPFFPDNKSSESSSSSLSTSIPKENYVVTEKPIEDFEFSISAATVVAAEIVETGLVSLEPLISQVKPAQISTISHGSSLIANDWSQIPTKEEEAAKVMKNKLNVLQTELEETEHKFIQSSRNLEQSQRRIALLEQELKEQRKIATASKSANEAQMASMRAINHEMAAKLSSIEAGFLDASNARIEESDRSRELSSRLQSEIICIQEEKKDLCRQMSSLVNENILLNEKANLVDSLKFKCEKLEKELEESRRALSIEIEAAQNKLKTTLSDLENEIASHRAEHANSVGSSTALHQEIVQLKIDLQKMFEKESAYMSCIEKLEEENNILIIAANNSDCEASNILAIQDELNLLKSALSEKNLELEKKTIEMQNVTNELETVKLKFNSSIPNNENLEIEKLKSELNSLKSEIESLQSSNSDIEFLRTQLAESEIQISGLKSEVAREIKRANVSKIVYETKLAELNNKN